MSRDDISEEFHNDSSIWFGSTLFMLPSKYAVELEEMGFLEGQFKHQHPNYYLKVGIMFKFYNYTTVCKGWIDQSNEGL